MHVGCDILVIRVLIPHICSLLNLGLYVICLTRVMYVIHIMSIEPFYFILVLKVMHVSQVSRVINPNPFPRRYIVARAVHIIRVACSTF